MATKQDIWRFEVRERGPGEARGSGLPEDARALGLGRVTHARTAKLFFVRGTMAPEELDLLGRFLFSDQVVQESAMRRVLPAHEGGAEKIAIVEVLPRPGVTDMEAHEALRAARELGIDSLDAVSVGRGRELEGEALDASFLDKLASSLLANPLVERWALGEIEPIFLDEGGDDSGSGEEAERFRVESLDLSALDDSVLEAV